RVGGGQGPVEIASQVAHVQLTDRCHAFTRPVENSNATLQEKIVETRPFLGIASLPFSRPPSRPRDRLVRLIRGRYGRLSQPLNVASASPRQTSERHRNKQVPMLAAGADSRVLARLAAAQQLDRQSAAGKFPVPARGRH